MYLEVLVLDFKFFSASIVASTVLTISNLLQISFVLTYHGLMLLSGSLANSNIRNKHILISHKHKLILLPDTFS